MTSPMSSSSDDDITDAIGCLVAGVFVWVFLVSVLLLIGLTLAVL